MNSPTYPSPNPPSAAAAPPVRRVRMSDPRYFSLVEASYILEKTRP